MAIYKSNTPTKDGKAWYYMAYKKNFEGVNVKYKSKKYLTKREASEAEATFLLEKKVSDSKSFPIVCACFIKDRYKQKKESTAYDEEKVINNHILPFFKRFKVDLIGVNEINHWKQELVSKGYKKAYLNKIYNTLNQIFIYSIQNYGLSSNPVQQSGRFVIKDEQVKPDEEKLRYITLEQFNEFIKNVDIEPFKTIMYTFIYTGLRKGELQALQIKDVDFESNVIIVNKTLSVKTKEGYKITNTKNYLNRKVVMNKTLSKILKDYIGSLQHYTDYNENWFLFGCGRFIPQTTLDRWKHHYFSLCNVPEPTYHELRHSHVSLCINEYIKKNGSNVDSTKFFLMMSNRMGHSIEVMQRVYLHLFPTVQDEIVDLLDNI